MLQGVHLTVFVAITTTSDLSVQYRALLRYWALSFMLVAEPSTFEKNRVVSFIVYMVSVLESTFASADFNFT